MGLKRRAEFEVGGAMMMRERNVAIVLAAGRGTRMKSEVQKQYLLLQGKPVLYYSLNEFQRCPFMDEVVLVTGEGEQDFCKKEILKPYGFDKVTNVIAGGKERYCSVYEGLKAISNCTYVYIHDGARPFIDQEMLQRAHDAVAKYQACAVGMPVKDTIKISDTDGFAAHTPNRNLVWAIQTPQVFSYELIRKAYDRIPKDGEVNITDDAMVMETFGEERVKLVHGSYKNMKITTPEDLLIAKSLVS